MGKAGKHKYFRAALGVALLGFSETALADSISIKVESEPFQSTAEIHKFVKNARSDEIKDCHTPCVFDECDTPCTLTLELKDYQPDKYNYIVHFKKKNQYSWFMAYERLPDDAADRGNVSISSKLTMYPLKFGSERDAEFNENLSAELAELYEGVKTNKPAEVNTESTEAKPIYRAPPPMSAKLEVLGESGKCNVIVDVNNEGRTDNIRSKCTHEFLNEIINKSVSSWRYMPATENGKPVRQVNIESSVTFMNYDDPEPPVDPGYPDIQ